MSYTFATLKREWDEYKEQMYAETTANIGINNTRTIIHAGDEKKIGELTGKLRILGPGFTENGVNEALTKFAKSDFGGILNVNTAKAFLS